MELELRKPSAAVICLFYSSAVYPLALLRGGYDYNIERNTPEYHIKLILNTKLTPHCSIDCDSQALKVET